jgi:signal transduction histidine kinase
LVLAIAHADMGVLMLHDESARTLCPVIAHNMTEAQCAQFGDQPFGVGPFSQATAEHRLVRIRDAWRDAPNLQEIARAVGFRHIEILPFFRRDGRPLGALGMIYRAKHRATARAKLEEFWAEVVALTLVQAQGRLDAERARERATKTSEAKIQFLARMSHELRTPLQSISGYIDLLRAGAPDPLTAPQDRMMARIAESERILVHVIDDVITFARLEAGHVSYNIGPISVDEALRVTEVVVSPLALDHHVRIEIRPQAPGLLVAADGDKLKQILVNLTANAIKFTNAQGTVTLSCRCDGESVWFEVKDTGPGIAGEKLRDIFEPYVQLGAPLIDRFGGSGLGLTISREFASGMGGELTATSNVGHGSTFSVRLPREYGLLPDAKGNGKPEHAPRRRRADQAPSA